MRHREQYIQRPEDTKALVRKAEISLVRTGEITGEEASKEGFVCQEGVTVIWRHQGTIKRCGMYETALNLCFRKIFLGTTEEVVWKVEGVAEE